MFRDPLVSILPRLFIGVTSAYTYLALRKATKDQLRGLLALLLALLLFAAWRIYAMPIDDGSPSLLIPVLIAVLGVALVGGLYLWLARQIRASWCGDPAAVGSLTKTIWFSRWLACWATWPQGWRWASPSPTAYRR